MKTETVKVKKIARAEDKNKRATCYSFAVSTADARDTEHVPISCITSTGYCGDDQYFAVEAYITPEEGAVAWQTLAAGMQGRNEDEETEGSMEFVAIESVGNFSDMELYQIRFNSPDIARPGNPKGEVILYYIYATTAAYSIIRRICADKAEHEWFSMGIRLAKIERLNNLVDEMTKNIDGFGMNEDDKDGDMLETFIYENLDKMTAIRDMLYSYMYILGRTDIRGECITYR